MNFGTRYTLRHYAERVKADRRDALVGKICCIGLAVLVIVQLVEVFA